MNQPKTLRQRTLDMLALGHYADRTIDTYISWLVKLAKFYHLSLDRLSPEQVQAFLLKLIQEDGLAWSTVNQAMAAFRFFYRKVLLLDDYLLKVPARRKVTRRAFAYSRADVQRLFDATYHPKYKALFMMVYGSGLRVSEVVVLKAEHIESKRGLVRVEKAKGNKDRYTVLSTRAAEQLRIYYRLMQPGEWLFFGRDRSRPIPIGTVQKKFVQLRDQAGLAKGGVHTLRHSFATHMLENGADIYELKRLLGHAFTQTTYGYIHISEAHLRSVKSPADYWNDEPKR
jgi:integrase/recombinase XerD